MFVGAIIPRESEEEVVSSDSELAALRQLLGAVPIDQALDVAVRGDLLQGTGYVTERVAQEFETPVDGVIQPGTIVHGEIVLTAYVETGEVRERWQEGIAPAIARTNTGRVVIGRDLPRELDPVPLVSGEWVGRDDSLGITARGFIG